MVKTGVLVYKMGRIIGSISESVLSRVDACKVHIQFLAWSKGLKMVASTLVTLSLDLLLGTFESLEYCIFYFAFLGLPLLFITSV